MSEEWRPVVGYEDRYQVSSLGRVFSNQTDHPSTGRVLRAKPDTRGYPRVCLTAADGRRTNFHVHALVCTAFHGPRPAGMEVLHRDGTRSNREDNLRWGTHAENMAQARDHGVIVAPNVTLTDQQVLGAQQFSMAQIREKYGVSRNYAYQLARGSAPRAIRLRQQGHDTSRIAACSGPEG